MSEKQNSSLAELVNALPEVYQPIYGHPEISPLVSRECDDRLNEIKAVYQALAAHLRRPLKVLDLGCAQGYISLSLAAQGAVVVGIDNLAANVAVCNALREANPTLDVQFREAAIESTLKHLNPGDFDLMIGLSVFHHLCHQYGKNTVREWITTLMTKVGAATFELALASEPLYWAESLPEDEQYLLDGTAFVHELSRFPTHLSEIVRPLYVCSNRYWYLDGRLGVFDKWTTSHPLAGEVHQGTRRYFFGEGQLAKVFRLTGWLIKPNLDEIEQEAGFLAAPPAGFPRAPALFTKGNTEREAWLVREVLVGDLLIDLMHGQVAYDSRAIVLDVLEQLCALEEVGLYHNDVRAWNVIVGPDGRASLIDFGAISQKREDCVWPSDLILSFFIFIRDVATRNVDRISPLRQPFISPYNLPDPFNRWILNIWHQPVALWSFKLLRDSLQNFSDCSRPSTIVGEANALWMQAIERHLDEMRRHIRHAQIEVSDLDNRTKELEDREKELRSELTAETQRGTELEAELAQSRNATAQLENRLGAREAELADARNIGTQLEQRLGARESELADARNIRTQLEQRLGARESELAGVYRSLSWRMTTPLREANLLFKRSARMIGTGISTLTGRPRRAARRVLLFALALVQARPEHKAKIIRLLARFPRLYARLRAFAFPRAYKDHVTMVPSAAVQTAPELPMEPGGDGIRWEAYPPSLRKAYQQLMQARASVHAHTAQDKKTENAA